VTLDQAIESGDPAQSFVAGGAHFDLAE